MARSLLTRARRRIAVYSFRRENRMGVLTLLAKERG
jgi:hypothetical protein